MELAEIIRMLRRRWIATAIVCAVAVITAVGVRLSTNDTTGGAATVQLLVDSPSSALANLSENPAPLISRAGVFAQVLTSQAVIQSIAQVAHLPERKITAQGPYSGPAESQNTITPAEARSNQIVGEKAPYRLSFVAQLNEPVITTTVEAPTTAAAARIADSVYPGVQHYVEGIQREGNTPEKDKVTIRQLGPAQVGPVSNGSRGTLTIAAFLGVLLAGLLLILGIETVRKRDLERDVALAVDAHLESVAKGNGPAQIVTGERRR